MSSNERDIDVRAFNREAWNKSVENGNPWTVPVSADAIAAARRGDWEIILTPTKPVPKEWFPKLAGCDFLCLASGGGQQGPILAAAGANVTVYDNSPKQLAQDRTVAKREGLNIRTVEGDMRDLSVFADESFDLIVHPVSNCFVSDVLSVWREAYRVLRHGGALLSGFDNPVLYLFDPAREKEGVLQVRFSLPYSELSSISEEERARHYGNDAPLEFGHTLQDQIGGQIGAGFVIAGFYEDTFPGELISKYCDSFIATRAVKQ
ncbi:MAG: class I SAM-dependent methyltransferase [Candidatus Bipolaricaulota bacterium]|nr:class I SAM-dependent methyltransferase [Candidatus Bipolaricaulota bacterium]